jgi:gas vesicle protein
MKDGDSGKSVMSFILPFFIGGVIGAGVALLCAPKSGRETRQMIKEAAGNATEKVGERGAQVKDKVVSTVGKGKDLFREKKAVLAKAIEAGKEAYEKEKQSLVKEPLP